MQGFLTVLLIGLFILLLVAVAVIGFLAYRYSTLSASVKEQIEKARRQLEQDTAIALQARSTALQQQSQAQLQQWREQELSLARQQQLETARVEAQAQLAQWKLEQESAIRQDAIERSRAVVAGKITEHFVPYLPDFPFNPRDARFIGAPIDMIVFDGLDNGALERIVFVEIKTGASALTLRERHIRDAIQANKIEWLELRHTMEYRATVTPNADGSSVQIAVDTQASGA
jgi:predicted Holliday junction resolvase-like endonuclease